MLGLTVGVSLTAAVLVSVWPVVDVVRLDVRSALSDGGIRVAGSRTTNWMRRALIAVEVALACVLLAGAALFGRALVSLSHADLGFDPRGVLTAQMSVQAAETAGGRPLSAFYEETLERLRNVPGVESAAVDMNVPVSREWNMPIEPAGRIDTMRSIDWLTRSLTSVFFVLGVEPQDPVTLSGAALLLVLVAGAAGLVPASRAAWLDPAVALRHE